MTKFRWIIMFLLVFVPSVFAQDENVILASSANGDYTVLQHGSEITLQGTSLASPLVITSETSPIAAVVDNAANVFIIGTDADGDSQIVSATFADLLTNSVSTTAAEDNTYFVRLVHGWEGQSCVEYIQQNESSVQAYTRVWSAEDGKEDKECVDRLQPQVEVSVRAYAEYYADDAVDAAVEYDDNGRYELFADSDAQVIVTVSDTDNYYFSIGGNEFPIGQSNTMPLVVSYEENILSMTFPNGTFTATLQEIAGGSAQVSFAEQQMVLSLGNDCRNTLVTQHPASLQFEVCEGQSTLELAIIADSFGFLTDTTVQSYAHYDLRANSACWIPMVLEQSGQDLDAAFALMSFSESGNAQVNRIEPVNTANGTAYDLESYDPTQSGRIPTAAWLKVKSNGLRGEFVAFQDLAEPTADSHLCVADDSAE